MKQLFIVLVTLTAFTFCSASCDKNDGPAPLHNDTENNDTNQSKNKMIITVGTKIFPVTLNDNESVKVFKTLLPLTIKMSELNANEKFFYFSSTFPTSPTVGGGILTGDLMLYGDNCLVLFYENLNTSYSYTRLGKIDNTDGLKTALGTGEITLKFELR